MFFSPPIGQPRDDVSNRGRDNQTLLPIKALKQNCTLSLSLIHEVQRKKQKLVLFYLQEADAEEDATTTSDASTTSRPPSGLSLHYSGLHRLLLLQNLLLHANSDCFYRIS